jgi:uncharacterized protein (DUF1697 family)
MSARKLSTRYVAFLRAINVGGHTVKMDVLRAHFTRLGFTGVETVIASGNVIFEAAGALPRELESFIAGELERRLGYAVATFVRTPAELEKVVRHRPFDPASFDYEAHTLYVGFLPARPSAEVLRKTIALGTSTDELHIEGRELYWGIRTRFSDSPITGALLERGLGMPMTLRNVTTVTRIATKYASASGRPVSPTSGSGQKGARRHTRE